MGGRAVGQRYGCGPVRAESHGVVIGSAQYADPDGDTSLAVCAAAVGIPVRNPLGVFIVGRRLVLDWAVHRNPFITSALGIRLRGTEAPSQGRKEGRKEGLGAYQLRISCGRLPRSLLAAPLGDEPGLFDPVETVSNVCTSIASDTPGCGVVILQLLGEAKASIWCSWPAEKR